MKSNIYFFLLTAFLFAACEKEEAKPTTTDLALEAVEAAVWGKTLTQVNIPDFPFAITIDSETSFIDTDGDTHTFHVKDRNGLEAPDNAAYPGTSAEFLGDGYRVSVTLYNDGEKFRIKATRNGEWLMEGTFSE